MLQDSSDMHFCTPPARTVEAFDHLSDKQIPSVHHEQDDPVIGPNPDKSQKLSTATVLAIFVSR